MSGILQMLTGGTYKPAGPTTIGQAFGGGFYAGQIAVGGGGVATHYLIVAPKASGNVNPAAGKLWGIRGVTTGFTSVINGPTNSAGEAALGTSYEAATFCENLSIGTYTDWYLPAKNELEVLYYFLKPTTTANNTSGGSNANAVSPEPVSTNYSSGSPAQTSVTDFKLGGTEAFPAGAYWASNEISLDQGQTQDFTDGYQTTPSKEAARGVRAVRRIPI